MTPGSHQFDAYFIDATAFFSQYQAVVGGYYRSQYVVYRYELGPESTLRTMQSPVHHFTGVDGLIGYLVEVKSGVFPYVDGFGQLTPMEALIILSEGPNKCDPAIEPAVRGVPE